MTELRDDSQDGAMPRLAGFEMEGNMERVGYGWNRACCSFTGSLKTLSLWHQRVPEEERATGEDTDYPLPTENPGCNGC